MDYQKFCLKPANLFMDRPKYYLVKAVCGSSTYGFFLGNKLSGTYSGKMYPGYRLLAPRHVAGIYRFIAQIRNIKFFLA